MADVNRSRNVRIPDLLWKEAVAQADREGRQISEVVRTLLAEYAGMDPTEVESEVKSAGGALRSRAGERAKPRAGEDSE